MTASQPKYWAVLTVAVAGLVLICAGLLLASRSNPAKFSLDPKEDKYILLFAAAGFICTLAGIGLLHTAVGHTTKSIPTENRRKTNIGVGIGVVLQMAGLSLFGAGLYGLLFVLARLPGFIWGCANFAEGKGQSRWVGLVGVAGIVGLIVLIVLPDKSAEAT